MRQCHSFSASLFHSRFSSSPFCSVPNSVSAASIDDRVHRYYYASPFYLYLRYHNCLSEEAQQIGGPLFILLISSKEGASAPVAVAFTSRIRQPRTSRRIRCMTCRFALIPWLAQSRGGDFADECKVPQSIRSKHRTKAYQAWTFGRRMSILTCQTTITCQHSSTAGSR